MVLLCECARVWYSLTACSCMYAQCTHARTSILLGQAQVDVLAGTRTSAHIWDARNVIWSLLLPSHHCPYAHAYMYASVYVHLSRMCAYFQFSWRLPYCLRVLCILLVSPPLLLLFFHFLFRFHNSIVGSNKSSSWRWQSARKYRIFTA